jgi:hypothetical protein
MISVDADKRVETWRVLIVRAQRDEILLRTRGTIFSLPEITIPAQERIAANINRAVEQELGLRVISLYEICLDDYPSPNGVFYHAAVSVRSSEPIPEDASWVPIHSLPAELLLRAEDGTAVKTFRSLWESGNAGSRADPFLKPDWFREVAEWVEDSLRPHSLHLTGRFQQFNASSTFSLIRFETSGTPVWFKAVGEPNTREYAVTLALARVCHEYVPNVLATRHQWSAWLAQDVAGVSLASHTELAQWESAARSLAALQMSALPITPGLLQAGARDLGFRCLDRNVEPFFEFLLDNSTRSNTANGERLATPDLHRLKTVLQNSLTALDDLALPPSIGHMDLNPQNIIFSGPDCIFLDWAEAFVGSPFFSFEYLLQKFRQVFTSQPALEMRFREGYMAVWRPLISPGSLALVLKLSPLAALFAHAATVRRSLDAEKAPNPLLRDYLLRLVRKMRRVSSELGDVLR